MDVVGFELPDGGMAFFETTPAPTIRDAARGVVEPADSAKIADVLGSLTRTAELIMASMKAAGPDELTVQFGVKISAELGLPFISKGAADSNINVTLKWSKTSSPR